MTKKFCQTIFKISSFISQRAFEDPSKGSVQLPEAINLSTGKKTIYLKCWMFQCIFLMFENYCYIIFYPLTTEEESRYNYHTEHVKYIFRTPDAVIGCTGMKQNKHTWKMYLQEDANSVQKLELRKNHGFFFIFQFCYTHIFKIHTSYVWFCNYLNSLRPYSHLHNKHNHLGKVKKKNVPTDHSEKCYLFTDLMLY